MKTLAVFWDIENMSPSSKNNLMQKVNKFLYNTKGLIVFSYAAADWSMVDQYTTEKLFKQGYELIHIPFASKNAADKILIKKAQEIMKSHPEIDNFIVISSDSDYKKMLELVKQNGKEATVLYNPTRIKVKFMEFLNSKMDFAVAIL